MDTRAEDPVDDADVAAALAARARARAPEGATAIVALAGPVAVGKSTLADAVGAALRAASTAEVVSTDAFLLPDAELEARGILDRKGFPESYDHDALRAFLDRLRRPGAGEPLAVPVYSHETYDIVPGATRLVEHTDYVVVEGVNALYAAHGWFDLGVYVDAPLLVIEEWYAARFVHLCAVAEPDSFYARFARMERADLEAMARLVYREVNLPNLVEHIAPSRQLADVVVEKRADHAVAGIVDAAGG